MRIAYIAPYQGPGLLKRRPIVRNLALAGNVKIEVIAELLQKQRHQVDILSPGEVVERRTKLYRAFREDKPFDPTIPVFYSSSLPVKGINALWPALWTLRQFQNRHRQAPYDAVIIYNLQLPQMICALYAVRRLGIPVVLEHEDDVFVDVGGKSEAGLKNKLYLWLARKTLQAISGCVGVSPHLLSHVSGIPTMLLRGVVSRTFIQLTKVSTGDRRPWVVFSGTHFRTKGLEPLVKAWLKINVPGWELHIAGYGELTEGLQKMTADCKTIVFHGLLNREENARFLNMGAIGINPHDLSATPGNVFAFKIIEYLAARLHVITTPMGALENDLEAGITYMPDNSVETIAATIQAVIEERTYLRTAMEAAHNRYGPEAVAAALDTLLDQSSSGRSSAAGQAKNSPASRRLKLEERNTAKEG